MFNIDLYLKNKTGKIEIIVWSIQGTQLSLYQAT